MAPIRVRNYKLPVIRPGWQGNLFEAGDRFVNEEYPYTPSIREVLRWKFQRNPQRKQKDNDAFRLDVINNRSFVDEQGDCVVWLGHSTFYIRLDGVVLVIDPVFFDLPLVRRYSRHALSPKELGNVDYLLLSHDHRDHCQKQSVREILQFNPHAEILTGLQMDTLLTSWIPAAKIQCGGWYQQYRTRPSLAVCFLPARHWSKRSAGDTNRRLWGAFIIRSAKHTLYFGGDTGYGGHFREAASLFPGIDIAMLGIGAYKPSWFMRPNHISPEEAVLACNDLQSAMMVPMHYGTFDLSDEPPGEPIASLLSLKASGALKAELKVLSPGDVLWV